MPKPSQTLASCHQRTAVTEGSRLAQGLLLGDERFDLEDLLRQRGPVSATQVGVTDLAADLERLAVVVQMAIIDGDDLIHRRYSANEVEHRALAHLGGRTQRQGRQRRAGGFRTGCTRHLR